MHLLDALNESLPEVFRAIDLMGVLLNGILGGKVARERNFDAVGFCILAIMTALAGGMVRDMLLTTRTGAPVAITDPYYLWFAIIGAVVAMAFRMDSRAWSVLLVIADGMVLGCWSATGAIKDPGCRLRDHARDPAGRHDRDRWRYDSRHFCGPRAPGFRRQ